MSVKLYLRDNTTGHVHEYGTNKHDSLYVDDNFGLQYLNLQNSCGTKFPEEGYSFCFPDGTLPDPNRIETEDFIDIGGE